MEGGCESFDGDGRRLVVGMQGGLTCGSSGNGEEGGEDRRQDEDEKTDLADRSAAATRRDESRSRGPAEGSDDAAERPSPPPQRSWPGICLKRWTASTADGYENDVRPRSRWPQELDAIPSPRRGSKEEDGMKKRQKVDVDAVGSASKDGSISEQTVIASAMRWLSGLSGSFVRDDAVAGGGSGCQVSSVDVEYDRARLLGIEDGNNSSAGRRWSDAVGCGADALDALARWLWLWDADAEGDAKKEEAARGWRWWRVRRRTAALAPLIVCAIAARCVGGAGGWWFMSLALVAARMAE